MKTRILAVVTLYYPTPETEANIRSYADAVDGLFLWDNTPPGAAAAPLPGIADGEKVVRLRRGPNTGIGPALNAAARFMLDNGYTHLLTMDQDSRFAPGTFATYAEAAARCTPDSGFLLFTPRRIHAAPPAPAADAPAAPGDTPGSDRPHEVPDTIVSGSLIPATTLRSLGLFRADFVMDAIDTEYCLRIHRHGGRIGLIEAGRLYHRLGSPYRKRFLFWTLTGYDYAPTRTYYIARNFLCLKRLYPEYDVRYIAKLFILRRAVRILCVERRKGAKLRALTLGLWQGLRGKTTPDLYQQAMNHPR